MTIELKLVHGATTLSLKQSANGGWRLGSAGWYPASASMVTKAPVVETIRLVCDATSHDTVATDVQELEHMRFWAHQYQIDSTSEDPVWLHAKMQEEAGERRALIKAIEIEWLDPLLESDTGAQEQNELRAQIQIAREPWWEDPTGEDSPSMSETAGASLAYDYTGGGSPHDISGDLPARLKKFAIQSDATGARVGRLWLGLRSANKHGTLANFIRIWECEDGNRNAGETGITEVADATASGGTRVQLIETDLEWDDTWNEVEEIEIRDISANTSDQMGQFLWLLRCKVSAGTWEVQMRFGYSGMVDDDLIRGPIVEVSNTAWDYKEMGHHMFPTKGRSVFAADERRDGLQIWARRTSGHAGGGNLNLDCACPIPTDEGWAKIWNVDLAAGTTEFLAFYQNPDGHMGAFEYDATSITMFGAVAAANFNLPLGDGIMIIIYAGPTDSDITTGGISVLGIDPAYYERWGNLRGGA